ncbi:MAG: 4Fe-4S binding protein [Actinomycetota bacterium]|nr:4Fe-4S binding protein [Actinomycetota bacterium]
MGTGLIIIILSSIGIICGILIFLVNRFLPEEPDSLRKAEEIEKYLPGANCGACGYPGCFAYAQALAQDKDIFLKSPCTTVLQDPDLLEGLESVLGIEIDSSAMKKKAVVRCSGDSEIIGDYSGIETCRAASKMAGGFKECPYGCLGLGDCVEVCPVNAISIDEEKQAAVIDMEKCTGCGLCVEECPMNVIELIPADSKVVYLCKYEPIKNIPGRKKCKSGCLHCKKCFKACEYDAIKWNEDKAIPEFDHNKCTLCGECIKACPTGTLLEMSKIGLKLKDDVKVEEEKEENLEKV